MGACYRCVYLTGRADISSRSRANVLPDKEQPRPRAFPLKKWVESPGDEVGQGVDLTDVYYKK